MIGWIDRDKESKSGNLGFVFIPKVHRNFCVDFTEESCDGGVFFESENSVFVREFSDESGKWLCAVNFIQFYVLEFEVVLNVFT